MKDKSITRLRRLVFFVGTMIIEYIFIFIEIPFLENQPILELIIRIALLLMMIFVPDMVMKKIYPDYFRRINLDENDERAQIIKGKVAISTLKFVGIVFIISLLYAALNGDQSFVEYGFFAILLVAVYNKIAHMSYEERI